jgi:hypothetical protein
VEGTERPAVQSAANIALEGGMNAELLLTHGTTSINADGLTAAKGALRRAQRQAFGLAAGFAAASEAGAAGAAFLWWLRLLLPEFA